MIRLRTAAFADDPYYTNDPDLRYASDLVLLDRTPIKSDQNLHKISAVIRRGVSYSSNDLNVLMQRAAERLCSE